jgi:hypothetical protein
MTRTFDDAEKLWCGINKVDNLRDEEKHQRFAKMAQDADDCKRHPSKITVSVSNEDLGRISVAVLGH